MSDQKTFLEAIIAYKAINCLQEVLLSKTYLNLLDVGSDQLPLASHILRLNEWDSFRLFCISQIPEFGSQRFYQSLITRLQQHPEREIHVQNAETIAITGPRRIQSQTAVSMKLFALVVGKIDVFKPFYDKYQLRASLLQHLEQEVDVKMATLKTFNRTLHDQLVTDSSPSSKVTSSRALLEQIPMELAVEHSMSMIGRLLNEASAPIEKMMELQIEFYHELNEALYYYLPSESADELSKSQRGKLYKKHFDAFLTVDATFNAERRKSKEIKKISQEMDVLKKKALKAKAKGSNMTGLMEKYSVLNQRFAAVQHQTSFAAAFFGHNSNVAALFQSEEAKLLDVVETALQETNGTVAKRK